MQAIVTKFISPTNHRPSRVKAQCAAGSIMVEWDYSLNQEGNHRAAAEALVHKLGWSGLWAGGGMPDNSGNVYVCMQGSLDNFFAIAGEPDAAA